MTYNSDKEHVMSKLRDIKDDMNQIREQFRVLGMPNPGIDDFDSTKDNNTRNIYEI